MVDITVGEGASATPLLTNSDFVFDSAEYLDSINSWNIWKVRLKAVTRAAYERRIVPLLLSEKRKLTVKWGIDTGTKTVWTQPSVCRVLTAEPQLDTLTASAAGVQFTLTMADELYGLNTKQRVVHRKGKISQIVEEIAAAYKMVPVVEPTGGPPLSLVQSFETDYAFIKERLLVSAASASGVADYYLYARGNELHFHTKAYKKTPLIVLYNVKADSGASALIANDRAQDSSVSGGGLAKVVAYSPLTGKTVVADSDPEKYIKFGQRLSEAEGLYLWGAHIGQNQADFELATNQARYSFSRDHYERISFAITNIIGLESGTVIALQLPNPGDSLSGFFHVEGVHVNISGGAANMAVTASRGEFASLRQPAAQVRLGGNPQVVQPQEAPGGDPTFESEPVNSALAAIKPAGG